MTTPYPQGNDITLVAYQPDLSPRTPQAFEIIFREVGGGGWLLSLMSPIPIMHRAGVCVSPNLDTPPILTPPFAHSTTGSGRTGNRRPGSIS